MLCAPREIPVTVSGIITIDRMQVEITPDLAAKDV